MNNFKAIYKILKTLDRYKGDEAFAPCLISAERLKISFPDWEQIMIGLQANGYIGGVLSTQTTSDRFPHIVELINPRITFRGMEYLAENSFMKKYAGSNRRNHLREGDRNHRR